MNQVHNKSIEALKIKHNIYKIKLFQVIVLRPEGSSQ